MPSYCIIGASRGIGYQYLKHLSTSPSNIIIGTARTVAPVAAQVTADALGPNVHIIPGDLNSHDSLTSAASTVSKLTNGSLDYLVVNGAYLSKPSRFHTPTSYTNAPDLFARELNESIQTNVIGVLYAINAFLPLLRNSSVKKIVVITSGMADPELAVGLEISNAIPYSISKTAVNMLVAKFAAELKKEDFVVLSLSPGVVDTDAGKVDEEMMTPENQASLAEFGAKLMKYSSTFKGPITPEESVRMMMEVTEKATIADSGAFLSHKGDKIWV